MAELKVNDNGPYKVTGVTLLDGEGKPMEAKETIYLCRCGQSSNKPFCDGTHNKIQFSSTVRA
jgi:CDGSH-type Zn-finger protein